MLLLAIVLVIVWLLLWTISGHSKVVKMTERILMYPSPGSQFQSFVLIPGEVSKGTPREGKEEFGVVSLQKGGLEREIMSQFQKVVPGRDREEVVSREGCLSSGIRSQGLGQA